ncbi:MAG: glucosaminidase domain-containing protein [Flavitalea sp.]
MKKLFAIVAAISISLGTFAQGSKEVMEYISQYREIAIAEMVRTGVPASIKLAQGIHETGAGKSELVIKSNNHFGIKCKSNWTGGKVYHDDDASGECFRSYDDPLTSYTDHSDFLKKNQRYAFLFQLDPHDYKGWAYGLKKAGYATNIRYSNILIKLIEEYNLQQYTLIALGELKSSDQMMVSSKPQESPMKVSNAVFRADEPIRPKRLDYPVGEFKVNNTKVIFVKEGTSLLAIANQYELSYSRLLEFNDMKDVDVLAEGQLIYLQRKRKVGPGEFHVVAEGETMYDIAQAEGIRLESLASLNKLHPSMQPAVGEKLHLQKEALVKPILEDEVKNVVSEIGITDNKDIVKGPSRHVVQTKETLFSIARKYGVGIAELKEWNRLSGTDLRIGQELVILKN